MRPILLGLLATALLTEAGNAQPDTYSANHLLPACKEFLEAKDKPPSLTSAFERGICVGTVETFSLLVRILPPPLNSCPPNGVTTGQEVRVIIAYIEARPQRMHEDFKVLALEAWHQAWPCK